MLHIHLQETQINLQMMFVKLQWMPKELISLTENAK